MGMDRIVRTSDNVEQAAGISSTQRMLLIITAQADRIKALETELTYAYRAGESVQVDLEAQAERIKVLEVLINAQGRKDGGG